ncbi:MULTISPECIES: DUF3793 family protein [Pelosinus]|uniref:DUF3793 domain-containing protein n=1 Tax=Pelosinus fermentans B4 TaxID=1149862 RepID=I8RM49_9FIRM|nr:MULTISPECIES: DUF3793 family protein [Pelosinus]EIW19800.1 Protein of unknown function DUF3793 [Pelosinus fermentans B4]EIW21343.1 hypothetical protein FA11_1070 [Pelosinus fermentans A11]OAM94954.1 Protein of unknown function DUF3793 [Pelosinus fermentans DSM 17108]SDR21021.1 Protein of unknown function [Pelosinus fermentans]
MCWKEFLQVQGSKNDADFFFKWLAVELAPTIYGEKPGTLLNLMDSSKIFMKTMWLQYGEALLANGNVEWLVLKNEPHSMKILFYRVDLLNSYVNDEENRRFLERFGYHTSMSLEDLLLYFKGRFQSMCPHEMGILLGIPLKDVMGFMGMGKEGHTCQGMWKVYGDPETSLGIMQRMEEMKSQVAGWMMQGYKVTDVLCGPYSQTA